MKVGTHVKLIKAHAPTNVLHDNAIKLRRELTQYKVIPYIAIGCVTYITMLSRFVRTDKHGVMTYCLRKFFKIKFPSHLARALTSSPVKGVKMLVGIGK